MGDTELKDAIERLYELPADNLPDDAEKRFLELRGSYRGARFVRPSRANAVG